MKTFLALTVMTFLIAGGIFLWLNPSTFSWLWEKSTPSPPQETPPQQQTHETYASTTLGLSLRYPIGYRVSDHRYPFSETRVIEGGVRFTVPFEAASGTSLVSDTYLAIEQLPRANKCTGDIYIRDNVVAREVVEGGVTYSLATTSSVGARTRVEEWVWALRDSEPCTAVRYFIHSTNPAAVATGTVPFDHEALLREFDDIRRSVRLSAAATTTP